MSEVLPKAVLLIGLTGSGKTPLGEYLEEHGISGARCFHLDFGEELRAIDRSEVLPEGLDQGDVDAVRKFIAERQLLTDETFYIAEAVFKSFNERNFIRRNDIVVLNGLPRKEQQAAGVSSLVDVRSVIYLNCPLDVAVERIAQNSGGDRVGRKDDKPVDISAKFDIFTKQTLPLIDYYSAGRAEVHEVPIGVDTSPGEIAGQVQRFLPRELGIEQNLSP